MRIELYRQGGVAESNSRVPGVAVEPRSFEPVRRTRDGGLLDAEARFYGGYAWCLNAFPTAGEVVAHLRRELGRVDEVDGDWQRAEVMTNVFMLSCAIADTVDDYVVGERFDFSLASAVVPGLGPGLRAAGAVQRGIQWAREGRLGPVRAWREAWGAGVEAFLKVFVAGGRPDGDRLSVATTRLTSLLGAALPVGVQRRRARVPAAFRTQDLTHDDILALGRRFTAAFPDRARPVLVVGLRTAGSYFAPLLSAWLGLEGYRELECVTIRPLMGLSRWEGEALARTVKKGGLAVIVDEPPDMAITLAKGVALVRKAGFAAGDVVGLVPVHPTRRDWATSPEALPLAGIRILLLDPEEWHKRRLLEPAGVEARLTEYVARGEKGRLRVVGSPTAERLNQALQQGSEEKFHTRLKRIYEVRLEGEGGGPETRYVLAKSVGWGWLSYHAVLAGERLAGVVPPVLGLRDGMLYTEWLPQEGDSAGAVEDRGRWGDAAAAYVAARVRSLRLDSDPAADLVRADQDKGAKMLAGVLARAYGWKVAAVLKRARLRHELARRSCPVPTLIDGKMRPQEWIVGPGALLKTDFEHHAQGKFELNVADPAYDLAEAMLYLGATEAEEGRLIDRYIEQSGDAGVRGRLFLNKLLAGAWAAHAAQGNLADGRLADRAGEFNRLYHAARDFLTVQTARYCGGIGGRPAAVRWHGPLVVLDLDGVLDAGIFGFPSASAAGLRALALLHAHDVGVAVNTARPLGQVQAYCRAYGFVGGVAEYGAVAWDAVAGRERGLVGAEALAQVERVRTALRQVPGVFQHDAYRSSIRAYTYEGGRTVALPTLMIRDVMAGVVADRLAFLQTPVDTAIVAKEVDKGRGLVALLALAGQRDVETIAIGDSEADLAMFRVATRSFAPAQIPCRAVARALGCRIAGRAFQAGLLESVRALLHPGGDRCARCRAGERVGAEADPLFWELLEAADRGRPRRLLQALLDPMCLQAFAAFAR